MRMRLLFAFIITLMFQPACFAQTAPVNVYSIPAACDGVTNDTVTINNFLASLGKGTAVLPKGDCIVNSTITIPNGVYLKGQGQGNQWSTIGLPSQSFPTRIIAGAPSFQLITFKTPMAESSGISDITLDMSKPNNSTVVTQAAIGVQGCDGIQIENVTIQNAGIGINIAPPSGSFNCGWSSFRRIHMFNVYYGLNLYGAFNTSTNSCESAATDMTFYDIRMWDFWGWGISLGSCADNNYFYSPYLAVYNPNTYGVILNQATPTIPNGIYGVHFYGLVMDMYNSAANPQVSIQVDATGHGGGSSDEPNYFIGGYIGQNTVTPAHPLILGGGSAIMTFSSLGDSNALSCSGTPSSSFASVNGFITHC